MYWESFLTDLENNGDSISSLADSVRRKVTAKKTDALAGANASSDQALHPPPPQANREEIEFLRNFLNDLRQSERDAVTRGDKKALQQVREMIRQVNHEFEGKVRSEIRREMLPESLSADNVLEVRKFIPAPHHGLQWRDADPDEAWGIYESLKAGARGLGPLDGLNLRICEPSFYPRLYLVEFTKVGSDQAPRVFILHQLDEMTPVELQQEAQVFYDLNSRDELAVTAENILEYISFGLRVVSGCVSNGARQTEPIRTRRVLSRRCVNGRGFRGQSRIWRRQGRVCWHIRRRRFGGSPRENHSSRF